VTKPCAEELTASSELADDALADAILQGLRKAGTWGLSKPLINVLFGRNLPVATVNLRSRGFAVGLLVSRSFIADAMVTIG